MISTDMFLRRTVHVGPKFSGNERQVPARSQRAQVVPPLRASTRTAVKTSVTAAKESPPKKDADGTFYFNFTGFPFPLNPILERRTLRTELVPGVMWSFEQEQGLAVTDVSVNVRMTVIKLESGGLWVHAPIAPTAECCALLKELGEPVKYIVLPTFAYEHKVFVGPFSRKFPKAEVWTVPGLWSFPLDLPPQAFGIFPKGTIQSDDDSTPWANEISAKVLNGKVGSQPFTEAAFFHKKSASLLVTDAVIYVPRDPPPIIAPSKLTGLSQDNFLVQFTRRFQLPEGESFIEDRPDTPEARRLGWSRIVLLGLYFSPGDLYKPAPSFDAVSEKLMVAPVTRTLVYPALASTAAEWVESICDDWGFKQIVPCHFSAPIKAGPKEFRQAFMVLNEFEPGSVSPPRSLLPFAQEPKIPPPFPASDSNALTGIRNLLKAVGFYS